MEETKFWTKGKIILFSVLGAIIIIIICSVLIYNASMKKKYIEFENQITLNAENYLSIEGITLQSGEWRKIDIKDILKQKLVINEISDKCEGYVLAEASKKTLTVNYKTYLKCGKSYESSPSEKTLAKENENKTEEQSKNDTIKPKIDLLGKNPMTVKQNSKFKDPGAVATDNIDGNITKKIKKSGKVDTSKEGKYTIKYTVKDKAGNSTSVKRVVEVEKEAEEIKRDETKPIITFNSTIVKTICTGSSMDTSKNGVYGYTAYDDVDGNITDKVVVSGSTGIINEPGTYELKYTVSDSSKNKYTITRAFNVKNCNTQSTTVTTPTPAPAPKPSTPSSNGGSSGSGSSSSSSSGSSSGGTVTPPTTNTTISVQKVVISPNSLQLQKGETYKLGVYVYPTNATNKTVTYSSTNTSVATVDQNGNVRAISTGTTVIKATSKNGKYGVCNVVVR